MDYYPFGMQMPLRNGSPDRYRFGYNGQEKDNEITGVDGSHNSAEYWMYDARVARRWNMDPVINESISPYACLDNSPIVLNDPDGDCATCPQKDVENGKEEVELNGVTGTTPTGGLIVPGKGSVIFHRNLGDEKQSIWVTEAFVTPDNKYYTWNQKNGSYEDSDGNAFDQEYYFDMTSYALKGMSVFVGFITGETQKSIKQAYTAYQKEHSLGAVGFAGSLLYQGAINTYSNLEAGGDRRSEALFNLWQFSSGLALSAGIRTTKSFDLLSFRGGWGPFGEKGLILRNRWKVDLLYRNPASGIGHGTLFSLKELRKGGNLLRWDYGTLHSGGVGWHSTFRFIRKTVVYGSSEQRAWHAPLHFWNYPRP